MLVIKHYYGAIFLPKGKEFCVYDETFPIDENGKRVQEGGVYYDLDIVIETQTKRYRFQEVPAECSWSRKLGDFLSEHINEDMTIDINDVLDEDDEYFEYNAFKTEHLL